MPLPRFRLRTLMIAVAVVAAVCAAVVVCRARRERFALIAARHTGVFPPISFADLFQPDAERRTRWGREVKAWHATMAGKYRRAARYPWLPVPADPPEPPEPPPWQGSGGRTEPEPIRLRKELRIRFGPPVFLPDTPRRSRPDFAIALPGTSIG